jgi:hypothetical protein
MMGMRMPGTCWAVFKRQTIKMKDWCIWLVDLFVHSNVNHFCLTLLQNHSVEHAVLKLTFNNVHCCVTISLIVPQFLTGDAISLTQNPVLFRTAITRRWQTKECASDGNSRIYDAHERNPPLETQ